MTDIFVILERYLVTFLVNPYSPRQFLFCFLPSQNYRLHLSAVEFHIQCPPISLRDWFHNPSYTKIYKSSDLAMLPKWPGIYKFKWFSSFSLLGNFFFKYFISKLGLIWRYRAHRYGGPIVYCIIQFILFCLACFTQYFDV
jgi:hypothetical protein